MPAPDLAPPRLAVVVKGYPRVSETFIAREIAGLERRGIPLLVVSLRQPYDRLTHPVHREIRGPVLYLPEYLGAAPRRVAAGQVAVWRRAPRRYLAALRVWLADFRRDPTTNRARRFGQAGVLAAELPASVRHLHVHFLHTPASVARYAGILRGLPVSLSAHAKDVWTLPAWELREKLADARFCVTCTASNRDYLATLAPPGRVQLVYHGLDREFFGPPPAFGSARDGTAPDDPVRCLTVGRLQPKKGFDVLLQALARLAPGVALTLVGYGPAEAELRRLARALGVDGRITWAGQLDHPAVRALYRTHDLFVLAPRIARDGDRDGLPNVVVEALSQGLPVVATRVAAIPEIVEDGVNGRLVPPEDPEALAAAIGGLVADPAARGRLGAAGVDRVSRGWDVEDGVTRLLALFGPDVTDRVAGAPDARAAGLAALPGA